MISVQEKDDIDLIQLAHKLHNEVTSTDNPNTYDLVLKEVVLLELESRGYTVDTCLLIYKM